MRFAKPLLIGIATAAFVQTAPALAQVQQDEQPAAEAGSDSNAIIVTARRREEDLQTVPVSIQAFSSEDIEERGIQDLQDLSSNVAGLRFGSERGKNGTSVSLRGLSRIPLGEVFSDQRIDSDGLDPVFLPGFFGPAFGMAPSADPFELILLDASAVVDRRYITEELQLLGENDSGTFNWIVGGFYSNANSNGPALPTHRTQFQCAWYHREWRRRTSVCS